MSRIHGVLEHRASILVAGLGSFFGVALLVTSSLASQMLEALHLVEGSAHTGSVLTISAVVFLALSLYVGAIVTSNTFSTVVAGRTRTIALMRLLGSTARSERGSVTREGLGVGALGGIAGALVGFGAMVVTVQVLVSAGTVPRASYSFVSPLLLLPPAAVVLSTVLASRVGSRRVLTVTPLQALGSSEEQTREETLEHSGRSVVGLVLFVGGGVLLGVGILLGQTNPLGVLVGVLGGLLSFSGVVAASSVVMPWALQAIGRLFGSSATARLATQNALRHPERSARATIGLTIGVTLVTTFVVALVSVSALLDQGGNSGPANQVLLGVFAGLTGFSAVVAGVGMVSNLSLSVLQRRREIGLLRALGFTGAQVRRMILFEAAQMAVTSIVVGLVLGTAYGWAGAQSLLGFSVDGRLVTPTVPLALVAVLVVAAVILTVAASSVPSRRATRITPTEALAAI